MVPPTTHNDGILIISEAKSTTLTMENLKVKALPASFYNDFLSDQAKEWVFSPIRVLLPLEKTPGILSVLSGCPHSSTFPFTSLSFTAKDPTTETSETTITIPQNQLAPGLQYSDTAGLPDLLRWTTGLQERVHGRKHGLNGLGEGVEGWRVSMGSGSQDLIYKAAATMVSPGDSVLVESPVYAGVIPIFKHLHCKQIEVPTDANGIRSESLREILKNWPRGKKKPKVLYTVPYGCNPTGMTVTLERRKEVLQLAREYNFIILEDDPYYYLYYGQATRAPSYFALEATEPFSSADGSKTITEVGRVLRFDSFSKILSAGLRIGFATGPEALLSRIELLTATSNLQVSSLTQMITFHLLQSWGYDNFLLHTRKVSEFYGEKKDVFERALERWLGSGTNEEVANEGRLAEWNSPASGMFF